MINQFECILDDETVVYKITEQNLDQNLQQKRGDFERSRMPRNMGSQIKDLSEIVKVRLAPLKVMKLCPV